MRGVFHFSRVTREGFEKETIEKRAEGGERNNHMDI